MKAMVFEGRGRPLTLVDVPIPTIDPHQVLVKVAACAICRTDLHIIDGELLPPTLPLILGHQIVGHITKIGDQVNGLEVGQRVGIPWLAHTCGQCHYCSSSRENLCDKAMFTGFSVQGGYAEYCAANASFAFPLPSDIEAHTLTPLLCAGMIGYRALRLAGPAKKYGFYGFGASATLLTQVVVHQGGEVYAFTRPQDFKTQEFAKTLGAVWAGGSDQMPPTVLDAAIIFAPVGDLFPVALSAISKGGRVISAGIHMSEIPAFDYDLLWGERCMCSVANLTRRDGDEFLALAKSVPIQTQTTTYPLRLANEALSDVRLGKIQGTAVLLPWEA